MKKLFTKAIEWLRRRVTALKDTRSVYVNVNDDENHVKGYGLKVMGDSRGLDDNHIKVSGEGLEVSGETVASYPLPLRVLPLTQGENRLVREAKSRC